MKISKYKLILYKNHGNTYLQLSNNLHEIRKWNGVFAELIFDKALIKTNLPSKSNSTIYLNKTQIQSFFADITGLYQMAMYHFNIEKDLSSNNFSAHYWNIAESLLLQVRINPIHQTYEALLSYFVNEFPNNDIKEFDNIIKLLIGKNLIQSIITEDGHQFFDKNTQPHDHIYFKQHNKLVDCSREIADFFSLTKYFKKSKHTYANIFYVNNKLSHKFN